MVYIFNIIRKQSPKEQNKYNLISNLLCGLVVGTEMYCFSCEVRTEFICYIEESRPPLWSSGQSSWLQIQRSRVRFPALQDFSK
jgi:hypothetical protein